MSLTVERKARPIEWTKKPLENLVTFEKGSVVPTSPFEGDGYSPYIGADGFLGNFTQFTNDPTAAMCEPSDVLMLWDGERSGLCATGLRGAIGSTVTRLRPKDGVVGRYLYHQLARHYNWIQARRTGTGVPHVPKDIGKTLRLALPIDTEVQTSIAASLDEADRTIFDTRSVIAKLQRMRFGALCDLLSRGIDETGGITDPLAHPELFTDTAIGKVPAHWQVSRLEDLFAPVPSPLRSGPFGSALLKQELKASGVPLLGIDNVHSESFVATHSRFVSEEKALELSRYRVRPLDLMITIMGTVGRCCVVPNDVGPALSSKHVWTISLESGYSPYVACWQINFAPWILQQLRRDEQGGVMTAIRSETLRTLLLPVPSPREMRKIDEILLAFTAHIRAEELLLSKQISLKTGFMDDVLSGPGSVRAKATEAA